MRKFPVLLLLLYAPLFLFAQYNVRFIVKEKTAIQHDSIYLSGSFNNWDSVANPAYRMQPAGATEKSIVLHLKPGRIEYKFNRGSWQTVEKHYFGFEVPNRVVTINKDTTLRDSVASWRDEILTEKWQALQKEQPDTSLVVLLASLAGVYAYTVEYYNADSAFYYTRQALLHLQNIKSTKGYKFLSPGRYSFYLMNLQEQAAGLLHSLGNYPKALELRLDNLQIAQREKDPLLILPAVQNIISDYAAMKDYQNELHYCGLLQSLLNKVTLPPETAMQYQWAADDGKADAYYHLHRFDSSLYYIQRLYTRAEHASFIPGLAHANQVLGDIYSAKDDRHMAIDYYKKSIWFAYQIKAYPILARTQEGLAKLYQKENRIDSALYYAKEALLTLQNRVSIQTWGENPNSYIADISPLVATLYYQSHRPDSAYKYLRLSADLKDSLYNVDRVRQFQNITFNESLRQQQQTQGEKAARQQFENRIKIAILIAGMLAALVVVFLLYKNNRQEQRANALLQQKNIEINKQNAQAQLEAALERVRAQVMAMRNSHDVSNAIGLLFTELDKLGIVTLRCGIIIIDGSTRTMEVWTAISTAEGRAAQISGSVAAGIHPLLKGGFEAWERKEAFYSYELVGKEVLNYYKAISNNAPQYNLSVTSSNTERQICSVFFFKEGGLFTFTADPISAETHLALEKFAAVFGLTYRRYLDLKVAEEQTRQAIKQAALDRVRAEIASMRSIDDLQRITPLIWRELHTLHVPFVRCGVFIVDEANQTTHAYLSTPEGQPIGVLNVPIDENEFTHTIVEHWRKKEVYTGHWNKEQFINWMQSMVDLKQIENKERYQGEANPPESLFLHFVPFAQGMLYVGNSTPLTPDEIQLVKSLAEAFAIAYARYEDFKQLEAAKNKVEATLHKLKATQRQLLQKEKMASLGELTAGVAHEIQNPLNFVNNFSEVSADLLTEMKEALSKDNKVEAITVADSLVNNLQKISYHGKRADAIVKGMLQHSRKSSGEKEPSDINALVDEYLRLAYHGFRVKDKNFNAILETHFDGNIGKINMIPQDIGRVLLNLFNNAFYAVTEKKKQLNGAFEPVVVVSTVKKDDRIEIHIRDNGNGIPKKVKDKIFQPFFTTKPPGEGTGLGLSLSYDIVTKGHGGELKMTTKEGEYAEFVIELPATNSVNSGKH